MSLLVGITLTGCDSAGPSTEPDPTPPQGVFAYLTRDDAGMIDFVTEDAETGDRTQTAMSPFGELAGGDMVSDFSEMFPSPDLRRAAYIARPFADATYALASYTDGASPYEISRGFSSASRFEWGPESRRLMYGFEPRIFVLEFEANNVPTGDPVCITCKSISYDPVVIEPLVFEGDTLRHIRGWNWGDDADHAVVAASEQEPAEVFGQYDADLYVIDIPTRTVERKLTSRKMRGLSFEVARGGRAVVANLGGPNPGNQSLITNGGETVRPLTLPDGYVPARGQGTDVTWGGDGRHVVLYQRLAEAPPEFDHTFAIGVIDSQDEALEWVEYGADRPDLRTRPYPVFTRP